MDSHRNASSDDIEFLFERRHSLACQVCGQGLDDLTEQQRSAHYDDHFSGQAEGSSSAVDKAKPKTFKPMETLKRKRRRSGSQDRFWHPAQDDPPPSNFTPGLVLLLRKALIKAHAKGAVEKAYLCADSAVHVETESFDRGWGCGYRNFLMSCAALMGQQLQPMYFPLLDAPIPPGVRNLQQWIEDAWSEGYDEEGKNQLKKLVGTSKWIGAAELYVAFACRGIPSNLVDFHIHNRDVGPMIQWIVEYFTQDVPKSTNVNDALKAASPVVITDKMPIVLQYSGHSRTIVGYERVGNKIQLLTFDPSRAIPQDIRRAALALRNGPNTATSPPRKERLSPKKFFKQVLRPHSGNSGGSSSNAQQAKRLRAGNDDDVIVIESDSEGHDPGPRSDTKKEELDFMKVIKHFRLIPTSLKKDKYQILYFPMTAPLTESERLQRKVVTSKKIS